MLQVKELSGAGERLKSAVIFDKSVGSLGYI